MNTCQIFFVECPLICLVFFLWLVENCGLLGGSQPRWIHFLTISYQGDTLPTWLTALGVNLLAWSRLCGHVSALTFKSYVFPLFLYTSRWKKISKYRPHLKGDEEGNSTAWIGVISTWTFWNYRFSFSLGNYCLPKDGGQVAVFPTSRWNGLPHNTYLNK